jgi:hypothetical protein
MRFVDLGVVTLLVNILWDMMLSSLVLPSKLRYVTTQKAANTTLIFAETAFTRLFSKYFANELNSRKFSKPHLSFGCKYKLLRIFQIHLPAASFDQPVITELIILVKYCEQQK